MVLGYEHKKDNHEEVRDGIVNGGDTPQGNQNAPEVQVDENKQVPVNPLAITDCDVRWPCFKCPKPSSPEFRPFGTS